MSLIATFGLVYLAGFTLNTMTLLGMALAVGVVIDDAIVVLENIERHRELGEDAFEAASKGTREIAFAATAATFSVAAVFLPVLFVQGLIGSFLRDFGLTVAGSVLISLFVALDAHADARVAHAAAERERKHGSIYHSSSSGFVWIEDPLPHAAQLDARPPRRHGRRRARRRSSAPAASGHRLQTEFFPPADEGIFFARLEARAGHVARRHASSTSRTTRSGSSSSPNSSVSSRRRARAAAATRPRATPRPTWA